MFESVRDASGEVILTAGVLLALADLTLMNVRPAALGPHELGAWFGAVGMVAGVLVGYGLAEAG